MEKYGIEYNDNVETVMASFDTKISSTQDDITKLEREISSSEIEISALKDDIRNLNKELSTANEPQKTQINNQIQEYEKKIQEIKDDLEKVQNPKLKSLNEQLENLKNGKNEVKELYKELDKENGSVLEKTSNLSNFNSAKDDYINALQKSSVTAPSTELKEAAQKFKDAADKLGESETTAKQGYNFLYKANVDKILSAQ